MAGTLRDCLRSARKIEWLVALVCVSCLLLLFLKGGAQAPEDGSTALEKRLESVLGCVEGAGEVRVAIAEDGESEERVAGVLVVAEGAGDLAVYMRLQRAVTSLLGVPAGRVEIVKME